MTTPRKRAPRARGPALTDASVERVFEALQALAVRFGSMAAAARVVGCSREAVRLILAKGHGVAPGLAERILSAAGDAATVERRPSALQRLSATRKTRRAQRRASAPAAAPQADPVRKHALIEQAAEERRAALDERRFEARRSMGPPVSAQSPLDAFAAVVATVLVRHTVDPVAELDARREGAFARRVERHALSMLLDRHGSPNEVAMAVRGRSVGASLQRNFARHKGDLGPLSQDLAREVQELLDDKRSAWAALLDALDDGEERAAE
jgi:sRNA-binding protein